MKIEQTRVPMLRFPEFSGEWKVRPLNQFLKQSRAKNKKLEFDKSQVLSVAAEAGVVNQIEYHGRSYAGVSVAPYGIVRKGELVYTKSPLKAYPYGIIKLNEYADGVVSTLYAVYSVKENVSGKFLDYYFYHPHRINRYLKPLVNIGAKNDMKVNNDYAISDPVIVPELSEQQKIVAFLTTIDIRIQQLSKKVALLEQYKKGVMQQIFSQEIRFKDDQGRDFTDWEDKHLGEVVERVTRKNAEDNQNVLTISGRQGLVSQQDYFNKSVSAKDVTRYYLVRNGEFAYNKSYSKGYPLGAIKRLRRYDKGVVSTLYICFKAKNEVSAAYLEQYFESGSMNREIHKIAQEGARNHGLLNVSVVEFFKDIRLPLPSLPEQQRIGTFLGSIEQKIIHTKKQLDHMQTFKTGLLQQMFV